MKVLDSSAAPLGGVLPKRRPAMTRPLVRASLASSPPRPNCTRGRVDRRAGSRSPRSESVRYVGRAAEQAGVVRSRRTDQLTRRGGRGARSPVSLVRHGRVQRGFGGSLVVSVQHGIYPRPVRHRGNRRPPSTILAGRGPESPRRPHRIPRRPRARRPTTYSTAATRQGVRPGGAPRGAARPAVDRGWRRAPDSLVRPGWPAA